MIIEDRLKDVLPNVEEGDIIKTETSLFLVIRTLKPKDGVSFDLHKYAMVNLKTSRLAYRQFDNANEIYKHFGEKHGYENITLIKSENAKLTIGGNS